MRRLWRRHLLALSVALFFGFSIAVSSEHSRNLTETEARELAIMALRPEARSLPKLRMDIDKGYPGRAGFYWFEATAFIPDASPVLGYFAVNQVTAEVWDPVSCQKLTSPDLVNLQRSMRKRIHFSDRDFARLSKTAPCEP